MLVWDSHLGILYNLKPFGWQKAPFYTKWLHFKSTLHWLYHILISAAKLKGNFLERYSKQMAPHSSTLAWKIPWAEDPGGLQSMGSLGVRYNWATSLSLFTFMHWRRKWQPTPVFLPGESQGQGSLMGCVYGVAQSRTRLKWLSSSSTASKYAIGYNLMW